MFVKRFHLGHVTAISLAVAAVAAALMLIAKPIRGATDSASLDLTGTVSAQVDVTVSPVAVAGTLDLTQLHSETSLKVADVTERSNVPAGYTVVVQSANRLAGGRCAGAGPCLYNAGATTEVPFTLLKGATSQAFTGSTTTWSDTTAVQLTDLASVANIAYAIGATVLPQGAYTETLTFTITSK